VDAKTDQTSAGALEPSGVLPRVLFYSHDTFGLGHLRRSRALATAITRAYPSISSIIMTGSPVAGRFAFPEHVDHVRLPGVTKNEEGHYVSQTLGLDIDDTTNLRAGIIKATTENFRPDLLIVDKEPTGFRGELIPALEWLKAHSSSKIVLGLRDVLDSPDILADEWARKGAVEAAETFYDEVWIYGLREIYDPTIGLDLSDAFRARMHWTGFLRRDTVSVSKIDDDPYILVTPGGGGDGALLVDLVVSAYEQDRDLMPKARIVYGPFLSGAVREKFENRIARLDGRVEAVGFESQIESLFAGALGVVAMGGYNTFCEILSFDKPALIVPRTFPRKEQYIRAKQAEERQLVRMLDENRDGFDAQSMSRAIRALLSQRPPSASRFAGLLDGLDYVTARTGKLIPNLENVST
jgi:predicted glycosyltransferase